MVSKSKSVSLPRCVASVVQWYSSGNGWLVVGGWWLLVGGWWLVVGVFGNVFVNKWFYLMWLL